MSSPNPSCAQEQAFMALMSGIKELDLKGGSVPSDLVLTGDHAFPLALNSIGQVLMAASLYGSGRIVVFGHEGYIGTETHLVKSVINWLKEGKPSDTTVGVHSSVKHVEENLKSHHKIKVMNNFGSDHGVGVYITNAYSVAGDEKNIVEFMKSGGGVLIGGQAWSWGAQHRKENAFLHFAGNKVSGVTGIYFSTHVGKTECLPIYPQIPTSWMSVVLGKDFEDDLTFLLQGVSDFDFPPGIVASEVLVHGSLAFPIGTTGDGICFLAGGYYGQGRVMVVSHEGLLKFEKFAPFWTNALHWLDEGRQGVVGVSPELQPAMDILKQSGLACEKTVFQKDLSVFACTVYKRDNIEELQEFVAEGGGLLLGGHAWSWAATHKGTGYLTEFTGNKILNKMGLTLLGSYIRGGAYKVPVPSQAIKDTYHFRNVLHRFGEHVAKGQKLAEHEEEWLNKLSNDCAHFLHLDPKSSNYHQIISSLTDLLKKCGMPQVCEKCPVKTTSERVLLSVGAALYKVCPNRDELLPYLIKENPLLPVVYNQRVSIDVDTDGREAWVSTGLYLSPGMKTYLSIPADILDKGWQVQVGCQTDKLNHKALRRAPCVCETFPVDSQMILVHNLWGGLIYLIAPANTKVSGAEVVVQMAVPAPYYRSGQTSLSEWQLLRTAPSPWAELEFENIILTVPSDVVRTLERPDELAAHWDKIMNAIADLSVVPHKFTRKERFLCEVQIKNGWMHAGYPVMAHRQTAAEMVSVEHATTKGLWGPIHELGHNQQRRCWEFPPHTTEATCNLWSVYVHETVFKIPRDKAHGAVTPENRDKRSEEYVKKGRKLADWSMWTALNTYIELQEKFGWDAFKKVFAAYHDMKDVPKDNNGKMNLYAVTFSETVGMNLTDFFKAWGWPIDGDTEAKVSKLPAWTDHPMAKYK